jgi:hypothetical protein
MAQAVSAVAGNIEIHSGIVAFVARTPASSSYAGPANATLNRIYIFFYLDLGGGQGLSVIPDAID